MALIRTTPALLRNNIPDTAFLVLGDDAIEWTSKLKGPNRSERIVCLQERAGKRVPQRVDFTRPRRLGDHRVELDAAPATRSGQPARRVDPRRAPSAAVL